VPVQLPVASDVQKAANDWPPGVIVILKLTVAFGNGAFPGADVRSTRRVIFRVVLFHVLAAVFHDADPTGAAVVVVVGGAVVVVVGPGTVVVVVGGGAVVLVVVVMARAWHEAGGGRFEMQSAWELVSFPLCVVSQLTAATDGTRTSATTRPYSTRVAPMHPTTRCLVRLVFGIHISRPLATQCQRPDRPFSVALLTQSVVTEAESDQKWAKRPMPEPASAAIRRQKHFPGG
jgi:hypothetical protein